MKKWWVLASHLSSPQKTLNGHTVPVNDSNGRHSLGDVPNKTFWMLIDSESSTDKLCWHEQREYRRPLAVLMPLHRIQYFIQLQSCTSEFLCTEAQHEATAMSRLAFRLINQNFHFGLQSSSSAKPQLVVHTIVYSIQSQCRSIVRSIRVASMKFRSQKYISKTFRDLDDLTESGQQIILQPLSLSMQFAACRQRNREDRKTRSC